MLPAFFTGCISARPSLLPAAPVFILAAMIAVVQRVSEAQVSVDGKVIGRIGPGLMVLAAVEATDTEAAIEWTAAKLLVLRIFRVGEKHFEIDIQQASAGAPQAEWGLLLVSNFTVAAETAKGRRPSLSRAAPPDLARELFEKFVAATRRLAPAQLRVETGEFGGDMRVSLTNDGPATFLVQSPAVADRTRSMSKV